MKELIAQGWKSDNSFKAGYHNKLEEAMKKVFPSTDLKGHPHIDSKLGTWKKNYHSLRDIIALSGVGLKGNFMIDIGDAQWAEIIKVDNNARLMRYKSWPYYEAWKEIFGKDRATGEHAEDMEEAWNDIRSSPMNFGDGCPFTQDDMSMDDQSQHEGAGDNRAQFPKMVNTEPQGGKKRKVSEDTLKLCEVLDNIGRVQDARLSDLVKRIGYQYDVTKARKKAFVMLGSIPNLSLDNMFDVVDALAKETEKLDVFMGLPPEARERYVRRLLQALGK